MATKKQPEHLALRSPFERAVVRELRRIADGVEQLTAAHARILFFPKPSTRAEVRRALEENHDDEE